MTKLPWFPLDAADFLGSRRVRMMSTEEIGAYILLLCEEWVGGPLPDDMKLLADVTHADEKVVRRVLALCFDQNSTTLAWTNERLSRTVREQESAHSKKVRAGKAGARARASARQTSTPPALPTSTNKAGDQTLSNREEKSRVEKKRVEKKKQLPAVRDELLEELWEIHGRGTKHKAGTALRKALYPRFGSPGHVTFDVIRNQLEAYVGTFRVDFQGAHLWRWLRDRRWEEVYTNSRASQSSLMQKKQGLDDEFERLGIR